MERRLMCRIWVNHYGWICGNDRITGKPQFTRYKDGAKPFNPVPDKETVKVLRYVENVMQCYRDVDEYMAEIYN